MKRNIRRVQRVFETAPQHTVITQALKNEYNYVATYIHVCVHECTCSLVATT